MERAKNSWQTPDYKEQKKRKKGSPFIFVTRYGQVATLLTPPPPPPPHQTPLPPPSGTTALPVLNYGSRRRQLLKFICSCSCTPVYIFLLGGGRRPLGAGTVFPGISRYGAEWLVKGRGSGGGRDEQLPSDGGERLVFLFGSLFLGASLAPISNTVSSDANNF